MDKHKNKSSASPSVTAIEHGELGSLKERFKSSLIAIMDETNSYTAKLDLTEIWPPTQDLPQLYAQLAELKQCLDSFRPIPENTIRDMQATWDIQYTYESNRIEGNSLTLDETQYVLEKGLTIGGKPLADHLEAINHKDAIEYIRDLSESDADFNKHELLNIHTLILKGIRDEDAGNLRNTAVYVLQSSGSKHEFPSSYLLPQLLDDYFAFYNDNKDTLHPVEMAAHLHQQLVNIHPFIDGNGRTARLVMNLYLLQQGYPITIIDSEMEKRQEYYRILGQYQGVAEGDSAPFEVFVANKVKDSLFEYLHFLSADQSPESEDKGLLYFKKIEPYLVKK